MTYHLTIATLRPSHIADLRLLARNPRASIQSVRRRLFQRLGLVQIGHLQTIGPKSWVLTPLGHETIENAPVVAVPNIPRSPLPASGYWVDRKRAP